MPAGRPAAGSPAAGSPQAALLVERERALGQLARLNRAYEGMVAASESSNADDEHDPEGATIAFERSQLGAQIAHVQAGLEATERALARLSDGGYGTCETCGQPIGAERLEARPSATTCITCASR